MDRLLALRITDTAEADLAEIWDDIATGGSEDVATRFLTRLQASFEPIRRFPLGGPARDHLAPGLRATFHGSYVIYYRPDAETVVIVRVLHGARDVAAIADQGGFA